MTTQSKKIFESMLNGPLERHLGLQRDRSSDTKLWVVAKKRVGDNDDGCRAQNRFQAVEKNLNPSGFQCGHSTPPPDPTCFKNGIIEPDHAAGYAPLREPYGTRRPVPCSPPPVTKITSWSNLSEVFQFEAFANQQDILHVDMGREQFQHVVWPDLGSCQQPDAHSDNGVAVFFAHGQRSQRGFGIEGGFPAGMAPHDGNFGRLFQLLGAQFKFLEIGSARRKMGCHDACVSRRDSGNTDASKISIDKKRRPETAFAFMRESTSVKAS